MRECQTLISTKIVKIDVMPTIKRRKIEPYSAAQMYQLVNDVLSYPQFLPWCKNTRIVSQTEGEMIAAIEIAKGPLNKWFETRNFLFENHRIELTLHSGPFKKLQGFWEFIPIDEQKCEISFELNFEFSFGPLALLAEPIFHGITANMIEAFSNRAKIVYGNS